jgi:3-hexulose-6-phosphate synthase/6-phospho-3-hexuloisomerase
MSEPKPPVVQLALDFLDLDRALKLAREAVEGGVDWLEAGTPLIKSEGIEAVRRLRAEFPQHTIVADLKTADAGRIEMEMAAKAGANVALALGMAADGTLRECFEAGRNYGIRVGVDLMQAPDPVRRAAQLSEWGADFVVVHCGIDEQMSGGTPFDVLRRIASETGVTLAVAGGLNSESVVDAVEAGASILIVGGAITKAADARAAARSIVEAVRTRTRAATDLFKRTAGEGIREILARVSTANISDGSHHLPCCEGIRPLAPGFKLVGAAVTVRSYPGDWSKPVQAIDVAAPGEVIVVDTGGVGPAIWGELATHSAIGRKLAGVVVDGAIRDTPEIRALKFPAFSRLVQSNAGEPKGFGEINVPITVGGVRVMPGDWIVGDDDGVMVLPKARAVEMSNYALDRLEAENRLRGEIDSGHTTLGKAAHLQRWEKKTS